MARYEARLITGKLSRGRLELNMGYRSRIFGVWDSVTRDWWQGDSEARVTYKYLESARERARSLNKGYYESPARKSKPHGPETRIRFIADGEVISLWTSLAPQWRFYNGHSLGEEHPNTSNIERIYLNRQGWRRPPVYKPRDNWTVEEIVISDTGDNAVAHSRREVPLLDYLLELMGFAATVQEEYKNLGGWQKADVPTTALTKEQWASVDPGDFTPSHAS